MSGALSVQGLEEADLSAPGAGGTRLALPGKRAGFVYVPYEPQQIVDKLGQPAQYGPLPPLAGCTPARPAVDVDPGSSGERPRGRRVGSAFSDRYDRGVSETSSFAQRAPTSAHSERLDSTAMDEVFIGHPTPPRSATSSSKPGLCPMSSTARADSGSLRTTASKPRTEAAYRRSSTRAGGTWSSCLATSFQVCRARLADEHTTRSMSVAFSRSHRPASAASLRPRPANGRS